MHSTLASQLLTSVDQYSEAIELAAKFTKLTNFGPAISGFGCATLVLAQGVS